MHVVIRKKRWELVFKKLRHARGLCDPPTAREKKIVVDQRLVDEEAIEVIVHEILHASNWDLAEEAVTETAEDIAQILWRLGYRRAVDGHGADEQ